MIFHRTKSGSDANAFLIEKHNTKFLIDAGEEGHDCDILLITHTHSDHFEFFLDYLRKCDSWWTTEAVLKDVLERNVLYEEEIKAKYKQPFNVLGFDVNHDRPCAAFVILGEESYCHITDTAPFEVHEEMKNHTYYSIESNYDPLALAQSDYEAYVKGRIVKTHLENEEAIELADKLAGEKTESVRFIHLSRNTNTPGMAKSAHDTWLDGKRFPNRIYIAGDIESE